jgi:hypothetical protein
LSNRGAATLKSVISFLVPSLQPATAPDRFWILLKPFNNFGNGRREGGFGFN